MSYDNNKESINNTTDSSINLNFSNADNKNIINSINFLSINDSINSNSNIKENNKSFNIDSSNPNLFSSKSTEYSSQIDLENNNKIFQYLYNEKNKIKNSIILLDGDEQSKIVYEKIICNYYNTKDKNQNKSLNKICFLILDLKKLEKLSEELKIIFNDKRVSILKGGRGKKMKNNYETFISYFDESDIFVAIPDVFYKLLSIGFIKIYQFSILFLYECHLCEGNHPYNNIIQEFYFYYLYRYHILKININFSLPYIIGFSDSPLLVEKIMNKDDKSQKFLINLSENLNCQIIISPQIIFKIKNISPFDIEEKIEYIKVDNHLVNENIDTIYKILKHYFIEKALKLCLNNYMSQNTQKTLNKEEIDNIYINYSDILKKKFYSSDKIEYIKIETIQKKFSFLKKSSYLAKIFEDILKYLLLAFQNLDINDMINIFQKYFLLFQNILSSSNKEEEYSKIKLEEIQYFSGILKECINAFQFLLTKKVQYNNDRCKKFLSKLEFIYNNNPKAKIIVFVPSRKLAFLLNNMLNRNKYQSDYLTGINTKKEELLYISLLTKTTYNVINEANKKYNVDILNILVCTLSIVDNLQINDCDYIIIFKEFSNSNLDYTKIKKLSIDKRAKLIIFTTNPDEIKNNFNVAKNDKKSSIFLENAEIVKDFRRNTFVEEKYDLIEKNLYYYIDETEAKVSIKNSIMLFNDINNWFITQNKKIIVNKFIDDILIGKLKKYKCKIVLDHQFGDIKIFSKTYSDKQTAEGDCYLQLISFLHKYGVINNNFRIIES